MKPHAMIALIGSIILIVESFIVWGRIRAPATTDLWTFTVHTTNSTLYQGNIIYDVSVTCVGGDRVIANDHIDDHTFTFRLPKSECVGLRYGLGVSQKQCSSQSGTFPLAFIQDHSIAIRLDCKSAGTRS